MPMQRVLRRVGDVITRWGISAGLRRVNLRIREGTGLGLLVEEQSGELNYRTRKFWGSDSFASTSSRPRFISQPIYWLMGRRNYAHLSHDLIVGDVGSWPPRL